MVIVKWEAGYYAVAIICCTCRISHEMTNVQSGTVVIGRHHDLVNQFHSQHTGEGMVQFFRISIHIGLFCAECKEKSFL